MELLQNRRYEPGDIIPDYYFHEIRTQIECIADVCMEGEISVYEALNIIYGEILCSMDYIDELLEKRNNLETGIEESTRENIATKFSYISLTPEELVNLGEITKEWEIGDLEKALEDMDKYNQFLTDTEEWLEGISEDTNYHKKRKTKIKQQIIRDGLPLAPIASTSADNANGQPSKNNITERSMNFLIASFPELTRDYPLLINKGFLKDTNKGPRWLKSKQSLAEYFKNQPSKIKRIPWTMIGNIFDVKNLKNSISSNGNGPKKESKDYEEWLKIKKTVADK
jgi:hypothetical protein